MGSRIIDNNHNHRNYEITFNIINRTRQGERLKGSAVNREDLRYNITTAPKGTMTEGTAGGKTLNSG